jgi:hypothetical protein
MRRMDHMPGAEALASIDLSRPESRHGWRRPVPPAIGVAYLLGQSCACSRLRSVAPWPCPLPVFVVGAAVAALGDALWHVATCPVRRCESDTSAVANIQ